LLDTQRWLSAAGKAAFNPKLWYMSKTPFHSSVFQEASLDILAAINGIHGRNKKVVVLDLDDTLWGGIVGDVGWERLRLGGHDPIGEAFVDFQRNLKRLVNRGILLAIASKNEEVVALEAIRRHPEMVLKPEDFAAWKINWQDKAENIVELLDSLNLGLDSAVFLDDSPFERARVREGLPQVLVPELPADPTQYASFLCNLRCFDNPIISKEDRTRTKMYVADRRRVALKGEVKSLGEWLDMLELSVIAEPLSDGNLERAAQLINKTNQINLSTRRLAPADLFAWAKAEGHTLWTFRVSDKFGDYGLCGISSLVQQGSKGRLLDFVLSCRVMGRGVEESMLCTVVHHARSLGCQELYAEFIPSQKNQPCEKWFQNQANFLREGNIFKISLLHSFDFPRHVRMTLS
jgi:FkbH-like protein